MTAPPLAKLPMVVSLAPLVNESALLLPRVTLLTVTLSVADRVTVAAAGVSMTALMLEVGTPRSQLPPLSHGPLPGLVQ